MSMITRAVLFKSIEASWGSAEIVTVLPIILLDVPENNHIGELQDEARFLRVHLPFSFRKMKGFEFLRGVYYEIL